jgi:hypothetical protein
MANLKLSGTTSCSRMKGIIKARGADFRFIQLQICLEERQEQPALGFKQVQIARIVKNSPILLR